jgi:leader peptidase (prepilin peptidase)/N-methyltransferase
MLLISYLAVVAVMDLEFRVILHPVSAAGAVIGLVTGTYLLSDNSILDGILTSLIGGAAGYAIMLAFYFLGEFYVRRMAKKKNLPADEVALGFGDVNLSGVIGLILGWPAVIAGIFYAILAGGVISFIIMISMLIAKKYRAFTAIPYAPFLILAVLIIVFA